MKSYASLATDLRRISYWIYDGDIKLSRKFLDISKQKYKIKSHVGCFNNIWNEIKKIRDLEGGKYVAADRAATLSSILMQESIDLQ